MLLLNPNVNKCMQSVVLHIYVRNKYNYAHLWNTNEASNHFHIDIQIVTYETFALGFLLKLQNLSKN